MIDLGKTMHGLQVGMLIPSYTGVIIKAGASENGDPAEYSAGDDSGYVLTIENPWGTQEQADAILAALKLRGAKYQPFTATSAPVDPAIEIGDAVSVNGTEAVAWNITTQHTRMMAADLAAPFDEEVAHDFDYQPKTVREFKREQKYTRSRLTINEEAITAEAVRATAEEAELAGRITITADAITSEVTRATAAEGTLGTRIDQRLNGVTISVSSASGSSTFAIKDGSTTLDTKTLDLSVKAVNIAGTLTIGQLDSAVQNKINGAVKRSSIIYFSTPTATAPAKPTAWVSATSASQETWTQTRPQYSQSYAYLFIARQTETEDGTYACTTPTRDYTTTVIDGANIITGSITANKISVSDLSALGATIGGWSIGSTTIRNKKANDYDVYLQAVENPPETYHAIHVAWQNDTKFYVNYGGTLYAKKVEIEGSGTIGGLTMENGTIKGIRDTNIAVGGISGGSGGSLGSGTITDWNTSSGINASLGYGTAFGLASSSSTASGLNYFNAGQIRARTGLVADQYLAVSGTASFSDNVTIIGASTIFKYRNYSASWQTITINGTSYRVLVGT